MVSVVSFLLTKHGSNPRADVGEDWFWPSMGAEYARKLFAGVDRHLQQPHQNYLVTDSPELAPFGVTILRPLARALAPGWWGKLAIFSPWGLPQDQKALYLDLDNVVCGPLDPIVNLVPRPILVVEDMYTPGLPNASTILFEPNLCTAALDCYLGNPLGFQHQYGTWPLAADQAYLADLFRPIQFMQPQLPAGMILNSRVHIEQGAPYGEASLVIGSWHPKPHESSQRFYADHWV